MFVKNIRNIVIMNMFEVIVDVYVNNVNFMFSFYKSNMD